MVYKVRVSYSRDWDRNDENRETRYDEVYHSYEKEFNTKEELALFILDLADKEDEEIIVSPLGSEKYGTGNDDYRELEIYNDYRE